MSKEFTIESFRQKLVEWAIDKEVKYVKGDVYHLILLREPEVSEFLKRKGFDGSILADAIEEDLNRDVAVGGKHWTGNQDDHQESNFVKDIRKVIEIQKEIMQDPALKTSADEKDIFQQKMDKIAYISSVLRFAQDEEKGVVVAKTKARLAGRTQPTALEVFKSINVTGIASGPSLYIEVGLRGYSSSQGAMGKKGFWEDETTESSSSKHNDFMNSSVELFTQEEAGQKLNHFLQRNPEEAKFLQNLITAAVNKGLDERLGPKPETEIKKQNSINPT